ncbi:hypothetical protein SAMN05660649_04802 [Desulfotomaculum arcticum]|uniref:Uncharacterized protein n=1 Tax=Desulfotruncus arcticus DSM 17038 TaxID=1121424 RepID=A0A1I2Z7V9_9FIRM|nr:hypothetical protein [Desulfotruncus arcticus]SFH33874.1 hypothetical protein SAMN05660649_04802 [Desulfotomaculum arcticum] [Desulfotruncus arcticus DSM 17038]
MIKENLYELHKDERGQTFIEIALVIILVVFAVAPFLSGLSGTTSEKLQDMSDKIGSVGTP